MGQVIDSKRIAKNTIFLYIRLLLVLGITLYTSRVVLDKLGIEDYGLYNVIYGIIGILSFLNATLSSGTSRFITFELGKGNSSKLQETFSTALYAHIFLAGLIIVFAETVGLWYVHHVLVCPPERFDAATSVYQISIAVTVISILQVPFTSEIIAHERMEVYAYIGIYEAVAKLLIVFLLIKTEKDKLILYAFLVAIVSLSVFIVYLLYTRYNFKEVRILPRINYITFKNILKFSGWNIVANLSNTLMGQGVIMLFNIFFAPVVVAAQSIANQISNAMMQFVNNVRQSVNPQIIKLYADSQYSESKRLTLQSAEYIFYLLLLMGIPLIMVMPAILDVWLVDVPEYASDFARLIVIQNILGNFSAAFYTPMVAANKIQKNSIISAVLCCLQFGLLYLLFNSGLSALWARYIGIIFTILWSFIVKPYILWKDLNYEIAEIAKCILKCMRTLLIIAILAGVIYYFVPQSSLVRSLYVILLTLTVICITIWFSISRAIRNQLMIVMKNKFHI